MTEHPYNMTLMMATHSPYIVNYLNVLIRRTKEHGLSYICPEDVNVYEIFEGNAGSLKTLSKRPIIDTRSMSAPITEMYTEFNQL